MVGIQRFRQLQLVIWFPVICKSLSRSLEFSSDKSFLNLEIGAVSKKCLPVAAI